MSKLKPTTVQTEAGPVAFLSPSNDGYVSALFGGSAGKFRVNRIDVRGWLTLDVTDVRRPASEASFAVVRDDVPLEQSDVSSTTKARVRRLVTGAVEAWANEHRAEVAGWVATILERRVRATADALERYQTLLAAAREVAAP